MCVSDPSPPSLLGPRPQATVVRTSHHIAGNVTAIVHAAANATAAAARGVRCGADTARAGTARYVVDLFADKPAPDPGRAQCPLRAWAPPVTAKAAKAARAKKEKAAKAAARAKK